MNTFGGQGRKNLLVCIHLVARQLNVARCLRLLTRNRHPQNVVPLHRGPLSRLVGILGLVE